MWGWETGTGVRFVVVTEAAADGAAGGLKGVSFGLGWGDFLFVLSFFFGGGGC